MALNTVFRLRTRGNMFGSIVEFGVHLQQVLSSGGASDLAGSWIANVMPLVLAASSEHISWTEIVISDVDPGTALTLHTALTQPNPGLIVGEALPGQNAACVQLRSLTKGRRHRGRFFFPGIGEAGSSNAALTGAQLTAIQNLAAQLLTFYGPSGTQTSYRLVVYSPPTPPFKPKPAPPVHTDTLITPVNTTLVDVNIRTQRRRAIGVGI
jgi:hypothetical protein